MDIFLKDKGVPIPAHIILRQLIAGISGIKPDFITGMYLTGSIALNDFHQDKSDIDFLILCNELPERNIRLQLEQLHKTIERKFRKPNLNGCYITPDSLNVHHSQIIKTLCFHEGRMMESVFKMAPVSLYELNTTAICLWGIPAQNLPVTIELKDVCLFLFENINTYWKNWVVKHSSLSSRKLLLLLIPRLTEWTILGIARQLYTLQTGKITSKTNAGYHCLEHLPDTHHAIIKEAISIRNNQTKHLMRIKNSYYVQLSAKRAIETLDCARYLIQVFNNEYAKKLQQLTAGM